MGSSSDFLIRMESDKNKQPEAASVAKKFSPFSVDSLLATKVKQKQSENNNDENTNETITKTTANHEGE